MSISSEINRIKTNIANAYTQASVKGATLPEQQNSANLADTISSIQTGGGTPASVEEKDINFYDYDGTRLYSYTLAEVQNLTELPELPSHEGLICQGWNWSLADIKAEGKETDVGAMYVTDDGKTRLYIDIATEGRITVPLCFRQSVANGVEVDWGDGSAVETFSGSGTTNILPTHTYTAIGKYLITLNPIVNCTLTLGADNNNNILGYNQYCKNMLYKLEIGKQVTNFPYISKCNYLETITIPNSITTTKEYMTQECFSLKCVILFNISNNAQSAFRDSKVKRIILSKQLTSIHNYYFQNNNSMRSVAMSSNIQIIGQYSFSGCYSLTKLIFPKNLQIIQQGAFSGNSGIAYYDFSLCKNIPTLNNTSAFSSIASDCKIIVPDALYDDWIAATNWSTYASYIIKKSDWEASQV